MPSNPFPQQPRKKRQPVSVSDMLSQSSGFKNSYSDKPRVERLSDPLGREMYSIDGKKHVATANAEPRLGGFVVSHTGAITVVTSINKETSIMGGYQTKIESRYLDSDYSVEMDEGEYRVLEKVVEDPCPFCKGELTERHIWKDENFGKILWRFYKYCEVCNCVGMSPDGQRDLVTWWNADEQMFDPDTKDVLYNPNFIDEE